VRKFTLHAKPIRSSDRGKGIPAWVGVVVIATGLSTPWIPAYGAFPGVNGRIAFSSDRDGSVEIYTMNPDGTDQMRLTNTALSSANPAWSSDGTKIVFDSNRDGNAAEIYVMNADGTEQTRLTNQFLDDLDPTWSPDSTKIAFSSVRDFDAHFEIYVMNADGSSPTNVSRDIGGFDFEPAWSPDGATIAFVSDRPGVNLQVWAMSPDGTGQLNLTNAATNDQWPAWSPDGGKIAFTRLMAADNNDIFVMNADGSGQTNLTLNALENDFAPAWSPDGTQIAFVSDRDGNFEIYTMNADGSGQLRRTNDPAADLFPDWQPLAGSGDRLVSGRRAFLALRPADPSGKRLRVVSRDQGVDVGAGVGSADDPTLAGGTLRVVSADFDSTYALPRERWRHVGRSGTGNGFRYVDTEGTAGPITAVLLKKGTLRAAGSGSLLGHSLASDPNPVGVVLTAGARRFCMTFGGTTTFAVERRFAAHDAPAPTACPP